MAEKIKISKINEVFIKIEAERGILQELSTYFTFFVPGAQFSPQYRNKIWDGQIRLLNLRNNTLYHGLLHHVETFCLERGYTIEYGENRPDLPDDYSVYLADKFYKSLDVQSNGEDLESREYQILAYTHTIRNKRVLLVSPTASGKSLIIYMVLRQLLDFGKAKRGIIIVPTTALVEQMYADFKDYSIKNGWNVEDNVHRIYEGKDHSIVKPITISTWQSMFKKPVEFFKDFDFVVGDEAHLFKAKSLETIMASLVNASYRLGTTGTLDGTKTHKLVLEGMFGPVKRVTTTKELMDAGFIAKLEIKCLIMNYEPELAKLLKGKEWSEELDFLCGYTPRNKFIKNLAVSLKGNTLILFQFVDKHGKILYDIIKNTENIGERKVFFVHGGVDTEEREEVRRITEQEDDAIIIASYGTFSTGTNIRKLDNAIFASPSKSRIRNLQSIGRILRLSGDKKSATLFDISDDLRVGDKMNHTLKHFVERTRIYNEEKFPYKIYKIGLKNGSD